MPAKKAAPKPAKAPKKKILNVPFWIGFDLGGTKMMATVLDRFRVPITLLRRLRRTLKRSKPTTMNERKPKSGSNNPSEEQFYLHLKVSSFSFAQNPREEQILLLFKVLSFLLHSY